MIVNAKIEEYLLQLHPRRDPILDEMENFGYTINFPILGPLVGTILYQYTLSIQAKRILELGSGFGYSAFWFAKGLAKDGKIFCTDFSAKNKEKAENYFQRARLHNKIEFICGDGLEIMNDLDGQFDIILNDVQKTKYPEVFMPAVQRLRKGGLLISDNVLWKAKVLNSEKDESTKAIMDFNRMIFESDQVVSSILPIRDGLGICIKK